MKRQAFPHRARQSLFLQPAIQFWGWLFPANAASAGEMSLMQRFSVKAMLIGGYNMAADLLTFRDTKFAPWGWVIAATAIATMIRFASNKWLSFRLLCLVAGYVLFQGTLTLLRANIVGFPTHNTYYYGSSFTIFALLWLASLLTSSVGRAIGMLLVPYMLAAEIYNFVIFNDPQKPGIEAQSYPQAALQEFPGVEPKRPLSFRKTYALWRAARAGHPIQELAGQFAVADVWLLREMMIVQTRR
jgi:hypothetical protein